MPDPLDAATPPTLFSGEWHDAEMRKFAESLSPDFGPMFGRDVVRLLDRVEALEAALEWALDVLEISLKRIDTIDGDTLSAEHYRIRAAGLAKAHEALGGVSQ